jgi:hypothetical protein
VRGSLPTTIHLIRSQSRSTNQQINKQMKQTNIILLQYAQKVAEIRMNGSNWKYWPCTTPSQGRCGASPLDAPVSEIFDLNLPTHLKHEESTRNERDARDKVAFTPHSRWCYLHRRCLDTTSIAGSQVDDGRFALTSLTSREARSSSWVSTMSVNLFVRLFVYLFVS